MNQVQKLKKDIELYEEKIREQIKEIQSKCKHKNRTEYSGYAGRDTKCDDCDKWL